MLFLKRCGLKGRAVALCVLLVLGAVVTVSTALIWQNYHDSLNRVTAHAVVHTKAIACSAESGVLLNDTKALARATQAAASDRTVCRVDIVDAQGKMLANLQRTKEPGVAWNSGHPMPGTVDRDAVRVERAGEYLLVVAPIWRESDELDLGIAGDEAPKAEKGKRAEVPLAFTAITYSLDPLYAELRNGFAQTAVTCLIVIAVGVSLTIVLVRQLLNPVRNLVQTATLIADGDLTRQASEQAVGEIGVLARAFNHMAASLRQYTENLEEQVHRRTAQLEETNQALLRAKVQAEAASEAKSQFLANMSHEIRTPMTAILGYSDMLLDAELSSDERSECVQTVHKNGEHLLSVINDILDISKIEAGRMVVEHIDCSVAGIIEEVASFVRRRALDKGLSFMVEYEGRMPTTIRSDPTRFRQILINLLGNAVKFTNTGGVTLIGRYLPGTSPSLQFDVVDTGLGMASDEVQSLFQPFTQADVSMTRKFGGTGLGLVISKRIAQLMGGDVLLVATEAGRGTTFRVTIPAAAPDGVVVLEDTTPAGQGVGEESSPAAVSPSQLAGRILLAEDGPDNQRLICRLLGRAGAEVTAVGNGELAVQKALGAWEAGQPYDLILMDMQMPVMDGYQAVRLLRQKGYTGPIVALTAHAMATDREKCLKAGCSDYLTKPVQRAILIDMARQYFRSAVTS